MLVKERIDWLFWLVMMITYFYLFDPHFIFKQ
jgi:hypothetical protein